MRGCGTAQFTVTSASYHLTHFEFPCFHVYYWLPDFYSRSLNLVDARKRKNQGPGPRVPKMPVRTENIFCNVHMPESFGPFSMESRNKSQIIGEEEFSVAISCGSNHKMTGLYDDLSDTTITKLGLFLWKEKIKGYVISQRSLFYCLGVASVLTWCVVIQWNRIHMYSVPRTVCYVSFSLRMRSNRIRFF